MKSIRIKTTIFKSSYLNVSFKNLLIETIEFPINRRIEEQLAIKMNFMKFLRIKKQKWVREAFIKNI